MYPNLILQKCPTCQPFFGVRIEHGSGRQNVLAHAASKTQERPTEVKKKKQPDMNAAETSAKDVQKEERKKEKK